MSRCAFDTDSLRDISLPKYYEDVPKSGKQVRRSLTPVSRDFVREGFEGIKVISPGSYIRGWA